MIKIVYELQHGFWAKRYFETQLIMLIEELHQNQKKVKDRFHILLYFSKAFDKFNHEKLILC